MPTSSIVRWGIFGTGNMASQLALALARLPDARLIAVASRSKRRADLFADGAGVPHRYGSYDALLDDPDVDVVYVATPHTEHRENTLAALRAGKHVLCEKPMALNAREAQEMVAEARSRGLFLMEAVWMRFLPLMNDLRSLLAEDAIGALHMLQADFGFSAEFDPASRLFDLKLAGGALLDVGVYPVNLASLLFGAPEQIASLAHLGETGVDEQNAITMRYPGGRLAVMSSSIRAETPNEAHISGANGSIRLHHRWWVPELMTVTVGARQETVHKPMLGNGYAHEADEVMRCVRDGLTESPLMPLDETLSIMHTLDQIRAQWGLVYPQELEGRSRGS
jgi:predicted dehydrogenase